MPEPQPELYVRKKGKVFGPFGFEDLQQLAERGKLSKIHQVSEDGVSWVTAGKYQPSIWERFAAPPPTTVNVNNESPDLADNEPAVDDRGGSSVESDNEYRVASAPVESQSNSEGWHYTKNDDEFGPINLSELMQLFLNGDLEANEEVWREGMANWEPASQVTQLRSCFQARSPQDIEINAVSTNGSSSRSQRRSRSNPKKNEDNPFYWYGAVWKQFVNFNGRARRKEYWYFTLCNLIVMILLNVVSFLIGDYNGVLGNLYTLAILLPGLGVLARRLHDTGRSGWWILIGLVPIVGFIVLLVFLVQEGDSGENQYGDDPIG